MQRISLFIIVFSLALSSCATQPGASPASTIVPTEIPVVEDPQITPTTSQPIDVASDASTSTVIFHIIPTESQVNYEVGETFINQGNVFNVAIGVTRGISGDVTIDYSNPQNSTIGTISVDISQFTSDSNRRDNAIRDRFLQSSKYPLATFTPIKIEGLPTKGEEGVDYPLKITGDLMVKETTKQVTFDATIRLEGNTLSGTATTTILMSDFGVGPISIGGILETQDEVKLTFTFVARPAQ